MHLTDQQQAALSTRDVSVALDAGAGCGKTFVLTQRFLSHLDPLGANSTQPSAPPAKLHELIAITFTDAAAREMRDRIRRACLARLEDASPETGDYWLGLLRSIDSARVSTIHGFCGELLRSHAVELGIDPLFQVLEASAAKVLRSESIDLALRGELDDRNEAALRLATAFDLSGLKKRVDEVMDVAGTSEFGEWLERSPEQIVQNWRDAYRQQYRQLQFEKLQAAEEVAVMTELLPLATPAKPLFAELRPELLEILSNVRGGDPEDVDFSRLAELARVQGVTNAKDWSDKQTYADYRDACTVVRDLAKNIKPLADEATLLDAARAGLDVAELARSAAQAYARAKQEASLLDFDDLLSQTHRLLTSPQFAALQRKLQSDIRLLLVDEFQDTDRTQVAIVKSLVGTGLTEGQLFFVGDFKQSIYRFRGAEPDVFRELQNETPSRGRLPLARNFRSQPAVLEFVNTLFAPIFGESYQPLVPNRKQLTPTPAVEFLWTPLAEKMSASETRRAEARTIAGRIRQMLEEKQELVVETSATGELRPRPVRPGDIAILFRAKSEVAHYEQALRDEGIDHFLVGGQAFYAQQEVYDVANLLKVIVSPSDEVALAGALRSPFFSLQDETLFWVAKLGKGLASGLAMNTVAAELSESEAQKLAFARSTLHELRQLKGRATVSQLLTTAVERTTYDAVILSEFLGERKLANLQKLIEQARSFDSYRPGDLDGFVRQLSEFIAKQPKEALAAARSDEADEVQLMSVHSSKGLEFPVVFVADIDRRNRNKSDPAAYSPQLGPLVHSVDRDNSQIDGLDIHRIIESASDEQEQQRLLYVACTRAADYLVLSSARKPNDQLDGAWLKTIAQHFDLTTGATREGVASSSDPSLVTVNLPSSGRGSHGGGDRQPSMRKTLAKALAETSSPAPPASLRPIAVAGEAIKRFSVSRLTGELRHASSRPAAVSLDAALRGAKSEVDPRGLGTLVHAILERLRLEGPNPIEQRAQSLAPLHVTRNWRQAASEAESLVQSFVRSARFKQMQSSNRVEREVEFLLRWPPDAPHDSGAYLQGYIDCLMESAAGELIVLDYKTNRIGSEDVSTEAEKYHLQLSVYAMAVEQATGRSPQQLCIHFMRPRQEARLAWDESSRQRAGEMIDRAIAGVREKAIEANGPRSADGTTS